MRSGGFSDGDLLRGVRQVAGELGHPPSLSEYQRLGRRLGLACGQTVCVRFGGWRLALEAAGLGRIMRSQVPAPRWHIAACWRALESVVDQLGDPPRYRRYAALAAGREDLPSGTTVRVQLGPWPGIAAALNARDCAEPKTRRPPPSGTYFRASEIPFQAGALLPVLSEDARALKPLLPLAPSLIKELHPCL